MRANLPELGPEQVVRLFDALLENADGLLVSADELLASGKSRLSRSLAILGLEELGKAIALFERRVEIAYELQGSPFVTEKLRALWRSHPDKLRLVLRFLREEKYWFGAGDPYLTHEADNPDLYLTTLEDWVTAHNSYKQGGFYVDLDESGDPVSPTQSLDPSAVAAVLARVHQIGWQLRLGEHIESKRQLEEERGLEPASPGELAEHRAMLRSVDAEMREEMLEAFRVGRPGRQLSNAAYRLQPTGAPFENFGRLGYEAQTRELMDLWEEMTSSPPGETGEAG